MREDYLLSVKKAIGKLWKVNYYSYELDELVNFSLMLF